jgi:hypothetical protein
MAEVCALKRCGAADGVRRFVTGYRCPLHTPAALMGEPEPDELLREHRERLAEIAAGA